MTHSPRQYKGFQGLLESNAGPLVDGSQGQRVEAPLLHPHIDIRSPVEPNERLRKTGEGRETAGRGGFCFRISHRVTRSRGRYGSRSLQSSLRLGWSGYRRRVHVRPSLG